MTAYRACPNCDGTTARPLPDYSPDGWALGQCDTCDLVYLRNPPPMRR
ncbi:hypothetical protein [Sulfitobacter aestuariivivens]